MSISNDFIDSLDVVRIAHRDEIKIGDAYFWRENSRGLIVQRTNAAVLLNAVINSGAIIGDEVIMSRLSILLQYIKATKTKDNAITFKDAYDFLEYLEKVKFDSDEPADLIVEHTKAIMTIAAMPFVKIEAKDSGAVTSQGSAGNTQENTQKPEAQITKLQPRKSLQM